MPRALTVFALVFVMGFQILQADHVIVCGGPALRQWEDLRKEDDRHDRWWANFVRASTLHMDNLRAEKGEEASFTWFVHKPGYLARGREDGKPYTLWIAEQATKRKATLIWFNDSKDFIKKLNSLPRRSVTHFDFFGHSNKYAFMFDYGNDIMAASTSVLHERDLSKIRRSIFAKNAKCKSWGCHTGASMSQKWREQLRLPLVGANGKTTYTMVGRGEMPTGFGGWVY